MHSESWILAAIGVVSIIFLYLLIEARRMRRARRPEYYGDERIERGVSREDAEFMTQITALNREMRKDRYDTRTLAELGSSATIATLDDNEVITGTLAEIVPDDAETAPGRGSVTSPYNVTEFGGAAVPVFEHEPATSSRVGSLLALVEEFDSEWHLIDGKWHAPAALMDDLHEGDWLHELLTTA
jgi:hypothetical protein